MEWNRMSEEITNPFLSLKMVVECNGMECDLLKISLSININNK